MGIDANTLAIWNALAVVGVLQPTAAARAAVRFVRACHLELATFARAGSQVDLHDQLLRRCLVSCHSVALSLWLWRGAPQPGISEAPSMVLHHTRW